MQAKSDGPDFRKALSQFATGVTIVTVRDAAGTPLGLTVNSFNSVSLTPPLVLWSLSTSAGTLDAFTASRYYAINVLAAHQLAVAVRFASPSEDRFGASTWHAGPHNVPLLEGTVASFVVANRSRYHEGDHVIFVGEVAHFESASGTPLIFHDGRYVTNCSEVPLPAALRQSLS